MITILGVLLFLGLAGLLVYEVCEQIWKAD
jgi:hypothetical protein